MFTRLSQFFNAVLVGALMALPFSGPALVGVAANAQSGTEPAGEPPKLDGRLPVAAPPAAVPIPALAPPIEGRPDAVVPPLARKRPEPGRTSVPIVAPPENKKGAVRVVTKGSAAAPKSIKPAPKPAAAATQPATVKKPPLIGRSSLGGPKAKPSAACAAGMTFDSRLLKCAKAPAARAAPASVPAPAAKLRPPPTATRSNR